jgi:hypothetical protein
MLHGYAAKDPAIVQEAIDAMNELAAEASEGTLPSLSEVVAAPPVFENVSFIEQTESVSDDYGHETSAQVEEIEIVEVVEVREADSSATEPDDKTKPIETVKDQDLF